MSLVANNIEFSYDENPALRGVNVTLNKGEFLCMLGPNGSGKSTLLHTLVGLHAPDRGDLFLDDKPLLALSAAKRARSRMGCRGCDQSPHTGPDPEGADL